VRTLDLWVELADAHDQDLHDFALMDEDGRRFELIDVEPEASTKRVILRIRPDDTPAS
jgi:hypothetical protein